MDYDRAIYCVEREMHMLREELLGARRRRWSILLGAMARHWNHRFENIILIEMQRPLSTRVETAARWNGVARKIHRFASPMFLIEQPEISGARLAFGSHWLEEATVRRPAMTRAYDVLQTVGHRDTSRSVWGSTAQTLNWAVRYAKRLGIELNLGLSAHEETPEKTPPASAESSFDRAKRCHDIIRLAAAKQIACQDPPARDRQATFGVALVNCVSYLAESAVGLDIFAGPPGPPAVDELGVVGLTDFFLVVQQATARILDGLQRELSDDLPV